MKKLALSLMVFAVFGFTDAYAAAKTTKAKRTTTTVAQAAAPQAPAKDPMCKVIVPDNQFGSHRDRYRCYR
jgi:hypothetical protein